MSGCVLGVQFISVQLFFYTLSYFNLPPGFILFDICPAFPYLTFSLCQMHLNLFKSITAKISLILKLFDGIAFYAEQDS